MREWAFDQAWHRGVGDQVPQAHAKCFLGFKVKVREIHSRSLFVEIDQVLDCS